MKIDYLAHLDPRAHHGGGEQVLSQLLELGQRRGHQIKISSASPFQEERHKEADLCFLADLFNCPTSLKHLPPQWITRAIKQPFVHFDNAYVDCCNLDYLPCNGQTQDPCPHKSPLKLKRNLKSGDWGRGCFAKNPLVQQVYRESKLNCFVSPLHQKQVTHILQIDTPCFVLRPLIDWERFTNQGLKRDIPYLFVGALGEAKGLETLRKEYGNEDLHLIGATVGKEPPAFGTWHGKVPYEEIPRLMNRAQTFVFKPRWPEPQGRVVVEAALCGCKLETNTQVGATSFGFDLADPNNLKGAAEEFWETLEGLL